MNWEIINNERFSLMEYRLMDQGDCKVIIKFNPRHQSARISCENQHRLFYFESAGSLSGKTIFKNEYGMEIGNLVHDKFHPKYGSLVIGTKKYQYALQNNHAAEWGVYENGLPNHLSCFSISANDFSAGKLAMDTNCCLLGFCCFLFLTTSKEKVLKYSTTSF